MDLDSLNLRITASTDQATKSIDKLIDTLGRLNGAFNIGGIDTFTGSLDAIATSLNSINSAPLKSLADSAARLAKVGKGSFDGVVSGMRSLKSAMPHESTIANMAALRDAVSKLGGKQGAVAGNALRDIASGIQALNIPIPNISTELGELAAGLRSLGSGNIVKASTSLTGVANGLNALKSVGTIPQIAGLADLGKAISVFGRKSASEAIVVIPQLAAAFRKMIETLSKAPSVKQSIIDMANAMANLTKNAKSVAPATRSAISGLNLFSVQAKKTQKTTFSLASAIGKLYASYWMLMRVFRIAGSNIKMASDLTETQNVVDHVFGQMKDDMEDFAKTSVETVGMSELTAKQIGSKFQAMASNMDISDKMLKNTNEFVQGLAIDYGRATESISDMSINLTQLAGDMASFYNLPYEDVAEDLESIFTGQIKPMRRFGVDLSVASLKAFALANGLNADIKNMTLAEKALLRYQYVMAHTTAAQNDFIRTQETWANQIKIAQENLKRLRVILGEIGVYTFKPLVKSFNIAMNDILHLAESTFNSLGKIFGWQIEISDVGILDDVYDSLDDVADGYDDAAKEGKKFKNFLLGIDELNLLPDDKDKGNGDDDLAGLYGDMGDKYGNLDLKKTDGFFDSIYDTLFKLGKRIGEVEKEWLETLDWDNIFDKARGFGKGLADFLNGYIIDADQFYEKGKSIANGINTVANAVESFFKTFDGWQFGTSIGSMINGFTENLDWGTIESAAYEMAHDIAMTINGAIVETDWSMVGSTISNMLNTAVTFAYTLGDEIKWSSIGDSVAEGINSAFETFDFKKLAQTLNKWAKGLLDALIHALQNTDWKMVGEKLGEFISNLDVVSVAGKVATVLWEVVNAAVELYAGMFKGAPIQTAMITALAVPFSSSTFRRNFGSVISVFTSNVGKAISTDLSRIMNESLVIGDGGFAASLNEFSSSLSTPTKIVGGIAAITGEFVGVSKAVSEIVSGTGDIANNIVGLVSAVGIATPALTLLFGIPGGLILAGASAAAGAVKGIYDALDKIEEDNIMSTLAEDIGGATVTLDKLADNYKIAADNITTGMDGMIGEQKKISGMKDDLAEMLDGFAHIKDAAELGASITAGKLAELVGDIGSVKKAWEDYINAQYDWLIQSTLNNMAFAKSQHELSEQEKAYYSNRITSLYAMKDADIEKTAAAMQELDDAFNVYNDLLANPVYDDRGFATTIGQEEAWNNVINTIERVGELQAEMGMFKSDDIREIESALLGVQQAADGIDFSNIKADSLDDYANAVTGTVDSINTAYSTAMNTIENYKNSLEAGGGRTAEQIEMELKPRYEALAHSIENSLDTVQIGLFDKFVEIWEKDGQGAAERYAQTVIKPFIDQFPEAIDAEGNRIQPEIQQALEELFDNDFGTDFEGSVSILREKYFGAGEDVGSAYAEGILATAGAADVFENIGKTSSYAYGNTERAMKPLIANSNALRDSVTRMRDEFGKVILKTDGMKGSFENLSSTFSTVKDKINNSKALDGVKKSADDVTTGFDKIKNKSTDTVSIVATNFGKIGTQISTVFSSITTEYEIFTSGFSNTFERLFAPDTWASMISSVPSAFTNMWNDTIKVMKSMWSEFAQWVNTNAKIEMPKIKIGNLELGGQSLKLNIPKFDVGGSIPNNGSLFFANERGPEVMANMGSNTGIMNTDQMEAAIANGMMRALSAGGQNVTVVVEGDMAGLFSAIVKENNNSIMRTGASPLRV